MWPQLCRLFEIERVVISTEREAMDQSRNNFPISVALFDPKPQAMVF